MDNRFKKSKQKIFGLWRGRWEHGRGFGELIKAKSTHATDVMEWSGQKRKPNKNINFIDVKNIDELRENSMDIISAWHVLHHIEDIKNTISEIKRLLKPGGKLVIYEHDIKNEMDRNLAEFQHRFFTMGMGTMTLKQHNTTYTKFRSKKQWEQIIGMKLVKVVNVKTIDFSYYAIFKN